MKYPPYNMVFSNMTESAYKNNTNKIIMIIMIDHG